MKYKACTKTTEYLVLLDIFVVKNKYLSNILLCNKNVFLKSSYIQDSAWMLKTYPTLNFFHHSSAHMRAINLHLTRRVVYSSGSLEQCLTQYSFWLLRHRKKLYCIMHNCFIYTNVHKNVSWSHLTSLKQCSYHIWKYVWRFYEVNAPKTYEYLKMTANIFVLQALIYILKQKMVYLQ